MKRQALFIVLAALLALPLTLVRGQAQTVTLTLAGYAVPREAYGDIIPLFQAYWTEKTGQQVIFLESYQASGAQSRAVAGGFEADIVALSIEPDVTRLVDAGLVSEDWKEAHPYEGFASQSVVILAVRPDNAKGIADWADLLQEGVEVITPDPATSGGAQWNVLAALGAVKRGGVAGFEGETAETDFLTAFLPHIAVLDRDGRESFLTFERGIGDVAITYENEVYAGLLAGGEYSIVYPKSTILIENPIAVVDTYVDKHGTREVAEAFVEFVATTEAQAIFADHGFRPLDPTVRAAYGIVDEPVEGVEAPSEEAIAAIAVNDRITFPVIEDLFTIAEFNGWKEARAIYFGDEGLFTKLIAAAQGS